jgi:sialic acid synthase
MRKIILNNKTITETSKPYVIAEIGNTHMGSMEVCKNLIGLATVAGADAVKLQKKDCKTLYTEDFYNSPFVNENSFGRTYGEHKEALEFDERQYIELIEYAKKQNITLFSTPFDEISLDILDSLNMPFYKIQSGDVTNLRFIEQICEKNKPIIMSTGGSTLSEITQAVEVIKANGIPLAILHCVSIYPALANEIVINTIDMLKSGFRNNVIGFSSHYNGILASVAAYMLGAQIIEQHFTLSHVNKGSDHPLSLQPAGLRELVHYLDELYEMKKRNFKTAGQIDYEKRSISKLSKSLYYSSDIEAGTVLGWHNVELRIPAEPEGMSIAYLYNNINNIKTIKKHKKGELVIEEGL